MIRRIPLVGHLKVQQAVSEKVVLPEALQTINRSGNNLSEIPDAFDNVERLILNDNNIR